MLGVKSPTDIEGIYNSYLDELQEKNRKERYEGKESWYHASGAGSCSRKLYFESVEQIKPTGVFDERTKRAHACEAHSAEYPRNLSDSAAHPRHSQQVSVFCRISKTSQEKLRTFSFAKFEYYNLNGLNY